jgi:hypothetical protein
MIGRDDVSSSPPGRTRSATLSSERLRRGVSRFLVGELLVVLGVVLSSEAPRSVILIRISATLGAWFYYHFSRAL